MRQNLQGNQRNKCTLGLIQSSQCNAEGNNLKYKHEHYFPSFLIHDFICKSHTFRWEWRLSKCLWIRGNSHTQKNFNGTVRSRLVEKLKFKLNTFFVIVFNAICLGETHSIEWRWKKYSKWSYYAFRRANGFSYFCLLTFRNSLYHQIEKQLHKKWRIDFRTARSPNWWTSSMDPLYSVFSIHLVFQILMIKKNASKKAQISLHHSLVFTNVNFHLTLEEWRMEIEKLLFNRNRKWNRPYEKQNNIILFISCRTIQFYDH